MIGPIIAVVAIGALWLFSRKKPKPTQAMVGFSDEKDLARKVDVTFIRHAKAYIENITSPFPFISNEAWREFVAWAQRGKMTTVTHGYNLGIYLLNLKQLQTVGLVFNLRQVKHKGEWVVDGDWKATSKAEFLHDPLIQYQAFCGVVEHYIHDLMDAPYVGQTLQVVNRIKMPTEIEVEPMTLSGLLGVLLTCGPFKMESWILNPQDREQYQKTTKAFVDTNGIF